MLAVRKLSKRSLTRPPSPLFLSSSTNLRAMSSSPPFSLVPVDPTSTENPLWSTVPRNPNSKPDKVGKTRSFYKPDGVSILTSLGPDFEKKAKKGGDGVRETVRKAIGSGVNAAKELGDIIEGHKLSVDASRDPHSTAVAAHLAAYSFTLKTDPPSHFNPNKKEPIPAKFTLVSSEKSKAWDEGVIYAESQNLARTLMEMPANLLTPTIFTERVRAEFKGVPNVEIKIHDEAWAAAKGMRTFLSVTKGTSEPAKFLEIHYSNGPRDSSPLVFVGKGITFDSGGISLKPSSGMKLMRGDMGGAATVVSAALGIAKLGLPINLVVLTPLCENLPGPSANKPGDIVYAMNGKSVEIDNTDAEGRLVLSDALYYGSTEFKPHTLVDVATLTGAIETALGEIYSGVFTNSDSLWSELYAAGERQFDRFWRMPLSEDFGPQIYGSNADLCNTGGKPGGSCTAALFLKHFVDGVEPSSSTEEDAAEPKVRWAHIDIAGTMEATRPTPYQEKGMTGRPTRALIEFAKQFKS